MRRGRLDATKTGLTTKTFAQDWGLDPLGNWSRFGEDVDGDAAWDLDQSRTANPVNEITSLVANAGPAWATPGYDAAGNMTALPKPAAPTGTYAAVYDAWNRLAKLTDGAVLVQENGYDAMHRRGVRKTYSAGTLTELRDYYYDVNWRSLEERVGRGLHAERHHVWGIRYVDDLVVRDRQHTGDPTFDERLYCLQDANWNVVAVADTTGQVVERYAYTAYGEPKYLTAAYADRTASAYKWDVLYAGYRLDGTGLYHVRYRVLHPKLGTWLSRDLRADGRPSSEKVAAAPLPSADDEHSPSYEYVNGNPPNLSDPYGLQAAPPSGAITCKVRICRNPIGGGLGRVAAHLYIVLERTIGGKTVPWAYRGGPGNDESRGKNCSCMEESKYGQLISTNDEYKEGFVDFAPPAKENCKEISIDASDCKVLHQCFVETLRRIDECCIPYKPIATTGAGGCNSNCVVGWALKQCIRPKGPIGFLGSPPLVCFVVGEASEAPRCCGGCGSCSQHGSHTACCDSHEHGRKPSRGFIRTTPLQDRSLSPKSAESQEFWRSTATSEPIAAVSPVTVSASEITWSRRLTAPLFNPTPEKLKVEEKPNSLLKNGIPGAMFRRLVV